MLAIWIEIAELWADRHDVDVPINKREAILEGRKKSEFYLAKSTIVPYGIESGTNDLELVLNSRSNNNDSDKYGNIFLTNSDLTLIGCGALDDTQKSWKYFVFF